MQTATEQDTTKITRCNHPTWRLCPVSQEDIVPKCGMQVFVESCEQLVRTAKRIAKDFPNTSEKVGGRIDSLSCRISGDTVGNS